MHTRGTKREEREREKSQLHKKIFFIQLRTTSSSLSIIVAMPRERDEEELYGHASSVKKEERK
jgi:hypothetical protein